ncbi:hypothetical protein JZ751_002032 [Albula glossodonta]|uniref:Uncharacterized protein n=1 Tax=Albula glossodonta TaxID=121402 RepID=A0A8T2PHL5_9TELE|nr:hypothetical protein JZ751_002032 [Albula glossodonta]
MFERPLQGSSGKAPSLLLSERRQKVRHLEEEEMKKSKGTMEKTMEERGQWGSKVEFLLAVAGNVVGLGNVWRFPYLCYKNGGGRCTSSLMAGDETLHEEGAFLVPYLLFVMTCGVPLFLLETSMGQYTQEGGITCWKKLCPLAEGHFGFSNRGNREQQQTGSQAKSLTAALGQLHQCLEHRYCAISSYNCAQVENLALSYTGSHLRYREFSSTCSLYTCVDYSNQNNTSNWTQLLNSTSAATEFWERRVLQISGGIELMGSVRWEVLLCLITMWVICYFCIWKGVKSTGKVVYFTATFPYLMLLVLLIRGLTLPGALQGVLFYLYPEPSRLADPQVWMEAGAQIFFSYSVGVGSLTVLGSYNTYNNNCYSGTSVVAGFAVFSVLGFMAHVQGAPIERVAESAMEVVVTSVMDLFPTVLRRAGRREIFLLFFCLTCFFSQLMMITEGGMYIFQLFDYYACNGACLLFLSVFEALSMGWLFGAERMYEVIEDMTGKRPNLIFKLCWLYLTPLVSLSEQMGVGPAVGSEIKAAFHDRSGTLIDLESSVSSVKDEGGVLNGSFIFSMVEYQPLTFNRWYVYPGWAYVIGWLLALSSIVLVPGWALLKLSVNTGSLRQRWVNLCQPGSDLPLTQKQRATLQHVTSGVEMEELMTNKK